MQGIYLRKYGVETKINFILFETDGVDFKIDAAHAAGDTKIMKDEGAEANTTNAFVDEGQGYSITLSATEMQAARIVVYIADQGTKAWLDTSLAIETYGNASAQHAVDLDDSVRAGLTALPNAAADAAGGLPISDAGGLDIDAILVDTNELQGLISSSKIAAQVKGIDDIDLSATMKASVNTEVDNALDTAIPGSPTANSVNERVKAIDDKLPTNYIMGSSSQTDKDDEIDDIQDDSGGF